MTWLVEERLPILLLGGSATMIMVLVVAFVRRLPALLGLIGVILLTGLLLLLEWLVVTEVETVENTLYQGATSLEQNDIPAALDHISSAAEPVRSRAERLLSNLTFTQATVENDLQITIDDQARPATATAHFTCHAKVQHRTEIVPYEYVRRRMRVTLVREGDRWMVTEYEVYR